MRVAVLSLGCKTNQYEADVWAAQFQADDFELVSPRDRADVYLLNTCTVTGEAGRKTRQHLRRFRKLNPGALVVALGCHAQLSDLSDVADLMIGTSGKSQVVKLVRQALAERQEQLPHADSAANAAREGTGRSVGPTSCPSQARHYEEADHFALQSETRAQLKIEEGCDAFCTYCAIPLARGRVRSRQPARILAEARHLIAAGYREIVLTGIHISSYGKDFGEDETALANLCLELAALPGMHRLRLGSLEPGAMTPAVIQKLQQAKALCPHFHLSLQSGSDSVLQRMGRRYNTAQFRAVVARLREIWPDAGITTDVMVGFPGETDAEFAASLEFCREIAFTNMHVFRYSRRAGTVAATLPDAVPEQLSRQRSQVMQQLARRMTAAALDGLIGTQQDVLLEQPCADGSWRGTTRNYFTVVCRSDQAAARLQAGQCVMVTVTGHADGVAHGCIHSDGALA